MTEYMKNLIWMTLIVSVLMQMLPGDKYNKIFGMAAGWMILTVLLSPILQWFGVDEIWQQTFAKALCENQLESCFGSNVNYDTAAFLQDLQADTLENQIAYYVAEYLGVSPKDTVKVQVKLKSDNKTGNRIDNRDNVEYIVIHIDDNAENNLESTLESNLESNLERDTEGMKNSKHSSDMKSQIEKNVAEAFGCDRKKVRVE